LHSAEAAPPAAAIDAFASVLADRLDATQVAFLIADFSGQTLVRVGAYARGSMPEGGADRPRGLAARERAADPAGAPGA
jgi:hypothetical protein